MHWLEEVQCSDGTHPRSYRGVWHHDRPTEPGELGEDDRFANARGAKEHEHLWALGRGVGVPSLKRVENPRPRAGVVLARLGQSDRRGVVRGPQN